MNKNCQVDISRTQFFEAITLMEISRSFSSVRSSNARRVDRMSSLDKCIESHELKNVRAQMVKMRIAKVPPQGQQVGAKIVTVLNLQKKRKIF